MYGNTMRIASLSVKLSLTMRDVSELRQRLQKLGLTKDQTSIFICLLDSPKTQLDVSRATGIARSNVYRIVDGMAEMGIVHELTTDEGKLLAGAKPEALELLVIEQETKAQDQRGGLSELLPMLNSFQTQENDFSIKTYSGSAGLKQMLWNELRSVDEVLIFSEGSLNNAVGKRWAERYRLEIINRGIRQRGISNHSFEPSIHYAYQQHYQARYVPESLTTINFEMTIHDDTLSIYNSLSHEVQLGTEIKNPFLVTFMKQIFEHYWSLGSEFPSMQANVKDASK
jgi:sugar-specific transcriptional regulator TrmB